MQPLGEFLLTLLRYLPFILLFTAICTAGVFALTRPKPVVELVGTSQVGLTQQVVWPFFDSARQRAVSTVAEESFRDQVAERMTPATGPDLLTIEVDSPDNQSFIFIEATAANAEAASEGANAAADLLLELDAERLGATARADFASAQSVVEASDERILEIDNRLAQLVTIRAEAQAAIALRPASAEARAELIQADLESGSLTQSRNEELRLRVQLQVELDAAEAALDGVIPELEILRRADPPGLVGETSNAPVVAAGAAAFVLGIAMAIAWDRTRGKVTSRWHAEQVARVPVLADLVPGESPDHAVGVFLTRLFDAAAAQGNIVAINGLDGVIIDRWLTLAVQHYERAGIRVVGITEQGARDLSLGLKRTMRWDEIRASTDVASDLTEVSTISLPISPTLVDVTHMRPTMYRIAEASDIVLLHGGMIGTSDSDYAAALADATLLVASRGRNTVSELRKAALSLTTQGNRVLGVVLDGLPRRRGRRGGELPGPPAAGTRSANGSGASVPTPTPAKVGS